MTLRLLSAVLVLPALILTGCTMPATNSNQNAANSNANGSEGPTLTAAQEDSIETVTESLETVAASLSGIVPTMDASAIANGDMTAPECPTFSVNLQTGTLNVMLDYGDGCSPLLYPDSTASGSIAGTITVATNSIDLTFTEFVLDGKSINGTMTGQFARNTGIATFIVTVDLMFSEGDAVAGNLTMEIDESTGVITVTAAEVTVTEGESGDLMVSFENVVMDKQGNGNFAPESGTATFDVPNEGAGPDTLTVEVTFTSQTPVDGSVEISINGSEPYTYTPADDEEGS